MPDNLVSNDVDQAIRFVETRCADSHQQGMFLELLREVKASNLPVQNISVMDLNGWRLRVTVPREEQCAYAVIDSVDSEDRVAVAWWNGLYDDHEEVCWTDLPLYLRSGLTDVIFTFRMGRFSIRCGEDAVAGMRR